MLPESLAEDALLAILYALGVVFVFSVIAYVVSLIIGRMLNQLTRHYESPLRSMEIRVVGALRLPLALIIVLLGLRVALTSLSHSSASSLEFIAGLGEFGRIVWLTAVTAIVCYTLSRLIRALMRWQSARVPTETRTALNTVIWPILIRISSIIIFALGALVVLDILGIPITPLLAGIGIGGLAIALALSPTISSFIAGTYVVAEGHISEGDYVEIDAERAGFVESVGWRSTVLRSRFNNMIVVPNSLITESIVTNYTTPTPAVTGMVMCGVSYDSDLREVERICLEVAAEVLEESEDAIKDFDPRVRFFEFADSNINFRIIFQGVDRVATFAMQHEIIMRLHARFKDKGIEINYPVRKLTSALPNDLLPHNSQEEETVAGQSLTAAVAPSTDKLTD